MAIAHCLGHLRHSRVCTSQSRTLLSANKKRPSTRMTYQTQGADLGGQGRRGTDFPTGAPQVHWEKERISASARGAPKSQPSQRIFAGLDTPPSASSQNSPKNLGGSEAGHPCPQGVDRSKRHVGQRPSAWLPLPRPTPRRRKKPRPPANAA